MATALKTGGWASKSATVLGVVLAGVGACAASAAFGEPTKKKLIFLAAIPCVALAAYVTGRPRSVLLFLWTLLLPYNRMYYSFDGLTGDHGAHGLYWIPTDALLLLLLALWGHDRLVLKRPARPEGAALARWFIPFLAVGLIATANAERTVWGLFDLYRLLKVVLILWYVRTCFEREDWWACVAGLGCSVLVQSGLAGLQMATRSVSGVLGLLGGGGAETGGGLEEVGSAAVGGWLRAVGTIGHPSNLACYFLLTIPPFVALALAARRPLARWVCAGVSLCGLGGLACTLSRWPGALMGLQLAALAVVLVGLRHVSAKRMMGLAGVGAFAVALALLPFQDLIYKRLTGDLRASLDFRAKDTRVALEIFGEHPFLGVGLNNYAVQVMRYNPELQWALEKADEVRRTLNIRTFVALHNFYLFMLVETGVIGLAALILFYLAVVLLGLRAVGQVRGGLQATGAGLMIGVLGVYGQGFVDFSFWVDPILYTFALVTGMLVKLPALGDAAARAAGVRPSTPP
ncbi:MAG: O-antigen ligase family protein [Planctomycetes bacterium]|nr:O-antigen ligase family protein [Planctomycetota bacterium]